MAFRVSRTSRCWSFRLGGRATFSSRGSSSSRRQSVKSVSGRIRLRSFLHWARKDQSPSSTLAMRRYSRLGSSPRRVKFPRSSISHRGVRYPSVLWERFTLSLSSFLIFMRSLGIWGHPCIFFLIQPKSRGSTRYSCFMKTYLLKSVLDKGRFRLF